MKYTPKISIIVPVYKAEGYLNRCVDSLLSQTFTDFEVLLIDDGSPDKSGEICDNYAQKDFRVHSYHKMNGGVSSARQYALDRACGEYVIHVDPDDWVEPDMLEELYLKAKETDADMVICDYYLDINDTSKYCKQQPSALESVVVLREMFQQLHGSCWNKLILRVCYNKFGIKFPKELSSMEDLYVNACIVSHDIRISYLSKAFYHYDQSTNLNSLIHRRFDIILQQERLMNKLLQKSLDSDSYSRIEIFLKYREARLVIAVGQIGLRSFKKDFKILRGKLHTFRFSIISRFIVAMALYVSPSLAHTLFSIRYRKQY